MARSKEEEKWVPREFYFGDTYFTKHQMDALANQLINIYDISPGSILEIGIGNGMVSSFLKRAGFEVTSFDINPNLGPDIEGDIYSLEDYFDENYFDLIVCAEVLEHLPFEDFELLISKIHRATRDKVYITLPRSQKILFDIRMQMQFPISDMKQLNFFWSRKGKREISSAHHWEIYSSKSTGLDQIKSIFSNYFKVEKTWRDKDLPYHQHFLLLKKQN